VEKERGMEYATLMNNQEWYSQVMHFCQLSAHCRQCPFFLLNGMAEPFGSSERSCFASKEALVALETWLARSHEEESHEEIEQDDDHQWLRDLLKVQFHEDDDEDEFFTDEQFI